MSSYELGHRPVRAQTYRAVLQALDRLGVDVAQNGWTGHHSAGTSYA